MWSLRSFWLSLAAGEKLENRYQYFGSYCYNGALMVGRTYPQPWSIARRTSSAKKPNSLPLFIERSKFIVLSVLPGLLRFILFGDGHLDDLPFLELVPRREIVHDRNLFLLPG